MKLDKLAASIRSARADWDLDAIDLLLLARIAEQMKAKELVTIKGKLLGQRGSKALAAICLFCEAPRTQSA